ncbi:DUF2125 domain-containing protein [Magnetovibrio sp. PR-2]|uniref:DUF2125 domain-containing protein n=1 Tax=Magnetovibrio sp. PR-2 TaxID=3120356 RepID=UPI002FCE3A1B
MPRRPTSQRYARQAPGRRPARGGQNTGHTYDHPALHYQKPTGLKRFQFLVSIIAAVAIAFGLWSFVWYAAQAWVKTEVINWIGDQRRHGAEVAYDTLETTGFPSTITVTLSQPKYKGRLFAHQVQWSSDAVKFIAKPWAPWNFELVGDGRHSLALLDEGLSWRGEAKGLSAMADLGDRWPENLDFAVSGLVLQGSTNIQMQSLRIQAAHNPDAQRGGTGLDVQVSGMGLNVPGALPAPLSSFIDVLELDARVTGSVQPGTLENSLPNWQESGGVVELDRLKFRSDPIAFAAGGKMSLTKEMQPQGQAMAKIQGLFQMLEILRAKGVMSDGEMVVATMGLAAMAKRPKNGGAPEVNLAIKVEDGTLSLGPLKVMKMPTVDWGFVPDALKPPPNPKPEPKKPRFGPAPTVF